MAATKLMTSATILRKKDVGTVLGPHQWQRRPLFVEYLVDGCIVKVEVQQLTFHGKEDCFKETEKKMLKIEVCKVD